MDDVTRALQALEKGVSADRELLSLVYEQLRAEAKRLMAAERAEHTLQATALVHEAYLRLFGDRQLPWQNRAHFYAAAAEAMRRILIDHARARLTLKRGGATSGGLHGRKLSLDAAERAAHDDPTDFLAVEDAISRLEKHDGELAGLVRLRFFAGLPHEEAAAMLGMSERSARRAWVLAKAWLRRELGAEMAPDPENRNEHGEA
ncbi:MAG: hypothetical protein JNG88_07320 [Phycisphaerales bacterium]|nr:hypothetical protein [Phycisphaerales bacterium]